MNLSRRGFLLGAAKTGALAILPLPLLVASIAAPVFNAGGIITRRYISNMTLMGLGSIERTITNQQKQGLYFNNKFLPTQSLEFNIRNNVAELPDLRGYRTSEIIGAPDVELQINDVLIEEDPYSLFRDHNTIKVDIVSGGARYSGDFLLREYVISGGF